MRIPTAATYALGVLAFLLALVRSRPQKEPVMLPVVSFILQIVPVVVRVIAKYGGIKGFLAAERLAIGAVRKFHADWLAAKAPTSDGGVTITIGEAMILAADAAYVLEDAIGPLLNVPAGTDPAAFGDELLMEIAPVVFRLLTHKDLADVLAAANAKTTSSEVVRVSV